MQHIRYNSFTLIFRFNHNVKRGECVTITPKISPHLNNKTWCFLKHVIRRSTPAHQSLHMGWMKSQWRRQNNTQHKITDITKSPCFLDVFKLKACLGTSCCPWRLASGILNHNHNQTIHKYILSDLTTSQWEKKRRWLEVSERICGSHKNSGRR